jgi:hypothetical protein
MMKSLPDWIPAAKLLACGANVSSKDAWRGWRNSLDRAAPVLFPPDVIVQVKAIACELPAVYGVPLSRWSTPEIAGYVCQSGLVATLSGSTIWRWLHEDAIKPWKHRSWIFPRDPQFAEKAGRILDLYHRVWNGTELREDEFVLCADEKTSIQARARRHPTYPAQSGAPIRVEHEYRRCGAWAYVAAFNVHHGKIFGRCEKKTGIAPFDRLVDQVMTQAPYKEARRVFWIVDNGSSHRGPKSVQRLKSKYSNLALVHGPVHASWLNQIEIYFSILERKALTPNDFPSLQALENRIMGFQEHYEQIAKPFDWKFTRKDLNHLISKIKTPWADESRVATGIDNAKVTQERGF